MIDTQSLYENLLSQLSQELRGYAPEYERFIKGDLDLKRSQQFIILNSEQTDIHKKPAQYNSFYLSMKDLAATEDQLRFLQKEFLELVPSCFELPTSDAVVMDIYKQFTCKDEYRRLYLKYSEQLPVAPHMTLGLIKDAMVDEMETIDFLVSHPPQKIVFSVYTPTGDSEPLMPIERAAAVFMYARKKLPDCKMVLNSLRPEGDYRKNLDILAFMHGVRTIVNPSFTL